MMLSGYAKSGRRICVVAVVFSMVLWAGWGASQVPPSNKWITSTAYAVPKEAAPQGEGYFALIEGRNGRLYIGTLVEGGSSRLVEFDPQEKRMRIVVDTHKEIGTNVTGFPAQSKIHTRCNVGASGKIYFATKQGHRIGDVKRIAYPGGYPMVYDPATQQTRVYPIPVPHQGIISITPDESRGVAYLSTCSDQRPDGTHFIILNLETGVSRDLGDFRHMYAFIVVDYLGRAYHPVLGGDIARYDPRTDKVERLKQTMDGQPPTPESRLIEPNGNIINWDISPDGKTLYAIAMNANRLYAYDLTAEGDTLPGRTIGPLITPADPNAPAPIVTDCRAMCVGPDGRVWASVDEVIGRVHWHHLVSYHPADAAIRDHGLVAIGNPDFTDVLKDKPDEPLAKPFSSGLIRTPEGILTTRSVTHGICEARDGTVYVMTLGPYTLLRIEAEALK